MKLLTSYFYNIRFFTPNMIPLSTALWDPKWYHDFKGNNHTFIDSNGVINGLRYEKFNPKSCGAVECCPCDNRTPDSCEFIRSYRLGLDKYLINQIISELKLIEQSALSIAPEPILVFIFHEATGNPCSERGPLIDYFKSNGVEIEEFIPTESASMQG